RGKGVQAPVAGAQRELFRGSRAVAYRKHIGINGAVRLDSRAGSAKIVDERAVVDRPDMRLRILLRLYPLKELHLFQFTQDCPDPNRRLDIPALADVVDVVAVVHDDRDLAVRHAARLRGRLSIIPERS